MLLWLTIAWLVLVGASLAFLGIRGAATYRRARTVSDSLQAQVTALEEGGLTTLAARTAELQRRIEQLRLQMDRLARSLAGLRILLRAWNAATGPFLTAPRLPRR